MSTFCDIGGGCFFFDRRILLLYAPDRLPLAFPLVCEHQGWGWRGRSTPFEDDVIRCQLPPPCEYLYVLSLLYDSHQKMQPLGQGSETTVSPKPSREASGSEEGVSPFLLRENLRECTGLLSMTSSCRDEVCLLLSGMFSIFFVSPYKPLSYIPLRGLDVYRRTTVVIESSYWEYIVYCNY